jgi:hypothetical protein
MKNRPASLKERRTWEETRDFDTGFDAFRRELYDYLRETRLRHNGRYVLDEVRLQLPKNLQQTFTRHQQDICTWLKRNGMPPCRMFVSARCRDVRVELSFLDASAPSDDASTGTRAEVSVQCDAGRETTPESVLEALQTSLLNWMWGHRVPGMHFCLGRVETLLTPENKKHLQAFLDFEPKTRDDLARKYLGDVDFSNLVTLDAFHGWIIAERFENEDGDGYWEKAFLDGAELRFRFIGPWDKAEAVAGGETARRPLLTLTIKSRAGAQHREVFSLNEFPLRLGRGSYNDVQIENEAVSRSCLRIAWDKEACRHVVESVGRNEIFVDGRAIAKDERQFLYPQGVIDIASDSGDPVTIRYQGAHSRQDEMLTLLPMAGTAHAGTAAGRPVSRDATEADRLRPSIDAARPLRRQGTGKIVQTPLGGESLFFSRGMNDDQYDHR